jgi:hypothetical protein
VSGLQRSKGSFYKNRRLSTLPVDGKEWKSTNRIPDAGQNWPLASSQYPDDQEFVDYGSATCSRVSGIPGVLWAVRGLYCKSYNRD